VALWRLLRLVDHDRSPAVQYLDLMVASAGQPELLLSSPFLREAGTLPSICPAHCVTGECSVTPDWVTYPGQSRPVPVAMCLHADCEPRAELRPEELKLWVVDLPAVAQYLSATFELAGPPTELVAGRVYQLGFHAPTSQRMLLVRGSPPDGCLTGADVIFTLGRPRPKVMSLPVASIAIPIGDAVEPTSTPWRARSSVLAAWGAPSKPWLTVTEAGELVREDFPAITRENANARVSLGANRGQFRTNGQKGVARRIEPVSFNAWRLAKRDKDLDAADRDDLTLRGGQRTAARCTPRKRAK
jgi:hypothetical protein